MFIQSLSARTRRAALLACTATIVGTVFVTAASAQVAQKTTTVAFSEPVEIPGVGAQVLPAGTYTFRLLDSMTDRNVVQILNKDQTHVYATILAVPNYRLKPTDKTVMTFAERSVGEPQALRAWFYPGEQWGQEFVYPKSKAVALARVTRQPVLYIPDETAGDAPVVALKAVPVKAVAPTGEDVEMSTVIQPRPATTMAAARLPKTASGLPLLALMGVLCLGAGFSLKSLCVR